MNMGLENVGNGDAALARQFQVNLYVGPRIDDCGGGFLVIADQVRDRGDAVRDNAFENK